MKIMRFNDSAETPALVDATIDKPLPMSGEVLIRVQSRRSDPDGTFLVYNHAHQKR